MATKPAEVVEFASIANYPMDASPEQGSQTKTDPEREDYGYRPNEHPTAQEFAWLMNLIGLWIQWLDALVSADRRYRHGTVTTFFPAPVGSMETTLSGNYDSIQGIGIINAPGWVIPIVLPFGERMTAVRALVRDNASGPTHVNLSLSMPTPGGGTFTANAGTDVCTITIGPHNMATGDGPFHLTTSGTLPAGLALATDYYIIRTGTDTFKLAVGFWEAVAGTAIDITDAGTGTHTLTNAIGFGLGVGVDSNAGGTDQTIELTGSWHMHKGSGVAGNANSFNRFVNAFIEKHGAADVRIYGVEVDHDMID